ncbi:phosphatase PAP2 family protein [Picosynechococcus sp. NKBG15041c]|uniref:phosphatase PAP2 family protein n=1 Tax=Picosynechococcus sp. NKBG15041c TaxID=1407650 RepID=UPI0011DC788F|nr:phosphatase PAP2 family protein [Picosynechococcus sp. NKBG15041c]
MKKDHFFNKIFLVLSLLILIPAVWLFSNIPETQVSHEAGFLVEKNFWFFLRDNVPPWLGTLLSFLYDLGDKEISGPVVGISLGLFIWKKQWKSVLLMILGSGGALLLVDKVFKPIIGRPRPPYFMGEYGSVPDIAGASFPSGHATGNLVLYLILALLVTQNISRLRWLVFGAVVLFLSGIGLGSLYLGVHWPSDILGGYMLGFIWLTFCLFFVDLLAIFLNIDRNIDRSSPLNRSRK